MFVVTGICRQDMSSLYICVQTKYRNKQTLLWILCVLLTYIFKYCEYLCVYVNIYMLIFFIKFL
jgi:hypothetical protein